MLEGFLSILVPTVIVIILFFVIFMITFRKKLKAMRDKEDSIYHRFFKKDNK